MKVSRPVATAILTLTLMVSALPCQAKTFAQKHPRRAEVLHRDNNINNKINADKGHLGGHYSQLERQDQSIHRQEQRDAHQNGGYITKGEQHHLNSEENHLNQEISRDHN